MLLSMVLSESMQVDGGCGQEKRDGLWQIKFEPNGNQNARTSLLVRIGARASDACSVRSVVPLIELQGHC